MKEVVLIPNPEEGNVLRASKRASLMSSGYVINDVKLDRTWTEEVLLEYLSGLFSSKFIDDNSPRRYVLSIVILYYNMLPCIFHQGCVILKCVNFGRICRREA